MLERSTKAKFAKSAFYEHVNDVDVYIEGEEELAKKILSIIVGRALGGKLQISTVFPLGNRQAVLDACIADQDVVGRPRVFIVDGDFSCLGCYSYPRLKRFFPLPRYCVENYLVDAQAFLTVLFEEDSSRDVDELEAAFDFDGWIRDNLPRLTRLFLGYSIAHRLAPHIPTVSRPVRNFVASNRGLIDPGKVDSTLDSLRAAVDAIHPPGTFDDEFTWAMDSQGSGSARSTLAFISGKDYLMPLLLMRLRSVIPTKSSNASLYIRLAQRSDVSDLGALASTIAS